MVIPFKVLANVRWIFHGVFTLRVWVLEASAYLTLRVRILDLLSLEIIIIASAALLISEIFLIPIQLPSRIILVVAHRWVAH